MQHPCHCVHLAVDIAHSGKKAVWGWVEHGIVWGDRISVLANYSAAGFFGSIGSALIYPAKVKPQPEAWQLSAEIGDGSPVGVLGIIKISLKKSMLIKITNLNKKIFSAIDAIVKSPRLQNVRSFDFFNK